MRRLALVLVLAPALAVADDGYTDLVDKGKDLGMKGRNVYKGTWEIREAMALDSGRLEAFRAQGAVFVLANMHDRGIFYLNEALKRGPEAGLTHYWLGMAHLSMKRYGMCKHHLEKARDLLKESDVSDPAKLPGMKQNIQRELGTCAKNGAGSFDAAAYGPAVRVIVEYAGPLYGEAPLTTQVGVEAGGKIPSNLIFVQAWDKDGRVLDASKAALEWSSSPGLSKVDGGYAAPEKPGEEWIKVTEKGSGQSAQQHIVVLGRPASIEIHPAEAVLARNQVQHLEVRGRDAAGHLVPLSDVTWSAGAPGLRFESSSRPDYSEPHRNLFEHAPDAVLPLQVQVTAKAAGFSAAAKLTVEKRESDSLQARARAVVWENATLQEAVAKAAAQKKPLFVEITAGWCPFCKRFEEGPLSDDRVGVALKDWLAVQIDADKYPELVERYGVSDLPAIALLSPRGTLIGRFGNNMEPEGIDPRTTTDGLLKALEEAKRKSSSTDGDEERKKGEATAAAGYAALARWYAQALRPADAIAPARQAMKADAALAHDVAPILVFSLMNTLELDGAMTEADEYYAKYPDGASAAQVLYYAGQAAKRAKNDGKAAKYWGEAARKWPQSKWGERAKGQLKK
jgi:tetratricopeptide (TPR) repeat protein